jgi:hypothetical protein
MAILLNRKILIPLVGYGFIDLIAVGFGMGIPILSILLGFGVGWVAPSVLSHFAPSLRRLLRMCIIAAGITSSLTFVLMFFIWGPVTRMLFDPAADIANFGLPMILYEPRSSFIGWIILMVIISPFLQGLATIFVSSVRLAWFQTGSLHEPVKE